MERIANWRALPLVQPDGEGGGERGEGVRQVSIEVHEASRKELLQGGPVLERPAVVMAIANGNRRKGGYAHTLEPSVESTGGEREDVLGSDSFKSEKKKFATSGKGKNCG